MRLSRITPSTLRSNQEPCCSSPQSRYSELGSAQSQYLLEEKARRKRQMEVQTGRLRLSGLQAETALESREKAHHQMVKGLEGQVTSDTPTPYRRWPGTAGCLRGILSL